MLIILFIRFVSLGLCIFTKLEIFFVLFIVTISLVYVFFFRERLVGFALGFVADEMSLLLSILSS